MEPHYQLNFRRVHIDQNFKQYAYNQTLIYNSDFNNWRVTWFGFFGDGLIHDRDYLDLNTSSISMTCIVVVQDILY